MSSQTELTRQEKIKHVHMARSVLKMKEADYRLLLSERWGVMSSKGLKDDELDALLAHFRGLGWRVYQRGKSAKAGKPIARKLTQDQLLVQVLEEGGHVRGYADAIAKRIARVDKYEWCTTQQRAAVIANIIAQNAKNAKPKGRVRV